MDSSVGLDFLQGSTSIKKRKLLCILESNTNRKNSITLGKAKDSVCDKKKCENTRAESIVSERCYKIKENIKGSGGVEKNDDIKIMQHHRKSRKLLHKKNMVKCRSQDTDSYPDVYENENYGKLSEKRYENLDKNDKDQYMKDDSQDYDYYVEELEEPGK